jgi:hypothetical protein
LKDYVVREELTLFPAKPERNARPIAGRFDGRFARKCLQEIDSAPTRTVKIRSVCWVRHQFRHKTGASVAYSKNNFMVAGFAFELHLARATFFASVTNRIRHAFGKCEEYVVPEVGGYLRAVELPASPFVDLFEFV